jgi:uncharacterized protein YcgI (DUF1989 family)
MPTQALIPGEVIGDEIVPARAYWHKRLDKGTVLRVGLNSGAHG